MILLCIKMNKKMKTPFRTTILSLGMFMSILAFTACAQNVSQKQENVVSKVSETDMAADVEKIVKTDEEWKEILSPEEYRITRQQGRRLQTGCAVHNRSWSGSACTWP